MYRFEIAALGNNGIWSVCLGWRVRSPCYVSVHSFFLIAEDRNNSEGRSLVDVIRIVVCGAKLANGTF